MHVDHQALERVDCVDQYGPVVVGEVLEVHAAVGVLFQYTVIAAKYVIESHQVAPGLIASHLEASDDDLKVEVLPVVAKQASSK